MGIFKFKNTLLYFLTLLLPVTTILPLFPKLSTLAIPISFRFPRFPLLLFLHWFYSCVATVLIVAASTYLNYTANRMLDMTAIISAAILFSFQIAFSVAIHKLKRFDNCMFRTCFLSLVEERFKSLKTLYKRNITYYGVPIESSEYDFFFQYQSLAAVLVTPSPLTPIKHCY